MLPPTTGPLNWLTISKTKFIAAPGWSRQSKKADNRGGFFLPWLVA
jgi:hypothetical protein